MNYEEKPITYLLKPEERKEAIEHNRTLGAGFCRHFLIPSLLYALCYTFFMYDNPASITMPLWVLCTIFYSCYVLKHMDITRKKDSILYFVIMLLLGISTALTDSFPILLMNYVGFFILLVATLLHNFFDDRQWDFGRYLAQIFLAATCSFGYINRPITDLLAYHRQSQGTEAKNKIGKSVLIGCLAAIPCLYILGNCLASADAVFGNMLAHVLEFLSLGTVIQVLFMFCFGLFSSYCGIRFLASKKLDESAQIRKQREPVIAITALSIISIMYVVFCLIQIVYLFFGKSGLPYDMTYAEYARTGFFQLLFVCAVNFIGVLLIKKMFAPHKILDTLLILFSICTFIMIASSSYRMLLYIQAYHLTFTRIFVLVALLLLTLLMVGSILMIVKPGFAFFRYSMIVVSVIYLCFSFAHVDYFIASYNLSYENTSTDDEDVDLDYISILSTDAAPAIASYIKSHYQDDMIFQMYLDAYRKEGNIYDYYDDNSFDQLSFYFQYLSNNSDALSRDDIRSFNLSHTIAQNVLPR